MSRQLILELKANTNEAVNNLKSVDKEINKINQGIETSEKGFVAANKDAKALNKTVEKTTGVANKAKFSFKAMGLALKAIGIGLLIKALSIVTELFSTNQKVMDAFSTAINFITIAFNDLFNFLYDNFHVVSDIFKKIFEDPIGNIEKFGNAIYDFLIVRFEQFTETLGYLGQSLSELFAGNFAKAWEIAKIAAVESVDIITGTDEGLETVTKTVTEVAGAIADYAVSTYEAADAQTELANNAEIAAAKNQGLVEQYDLQAEKLRQIRDDERNTIEQRKQANDDLLEILNKQETAMKANAREQLKLAEAKLKMDDENVEAIVQQTEALNEIAAIEAQIAGFRSEQKANDLALAKEELELNQAVIDGVNERTIAERQATDALIQDNVKRIQAQQETLAFEMQIEVERLQQKRALYQEGTQAYVDANEELLNYISDSNIRVMELDDELAKAQIENDQKEKDSARALAAAKMQSLSATLNATSQALGSLAELAGEGTKLGKASAIAQILIDTASGISSAIAGATSAAAATGPAAPVVTPLLIAQLVGQVLAGMASAKAILQKVEGPTASLPSNVATGAGGAIQPQAPQFNIVGQSAFNQIAGALGQPIQAYVVAQDVTTAQQLDNGIITSATLGGG